MIKRFVIFSLVVLFLTGVVFSSQHFASADSDDVEEIAASGPSWKPSVQISTTALGGKLPAVAASPNGRNVMIAYLRKFSANSFVTYFRESTNNADTWSSAQPIATNGANETGVAVDIAYDGAGNAHAVWTTLTNNSITRIYYAREDNWPSSTSFSSATNPGLVDDPAIAARGNIVVLIWAESPSDPVTDLQYRFSTNSGSSMIGKTAVGIEAGDISRKPAVAIDNNNRIHLVWQNGDSGFFTSILYSQGTIQGSSISWTTPIILAQGGLPPNPNRSETLSPQIEVQVNRIYVSYTRWGDIDNDFSQTVEYRQCNANCSVLSSWQPVELVSGQFLGIRANNPFIVKSTLTRVGRCSFVYFHGIPNGLTNEQIIGVNSCNNWFTNGRDEVTSQSEAAINPQMTSQNNWLIYLVYEKVADELGNERTVWFSRSDPGIYLPAIMGP